MRRNLDGFSLIELMIVIVLLTIAAGVIVPQFAGSRDDAKLRAAARELVATVRDAASRAVTTNRRYRIVFDRQHARYRVDAYGAERGFEPLDDGMIQLEPPLQFDVVRGADLVAADESEPVPPPPESTTGGAESETDVLHLEPDGSADARDVVIRHPAAGMLVVSIDPVTAQVATREEVERR